IVLRIRRRGAHLQHAAAVLEDARDGDGGLAGVSGAVAIAILLARIVSGGAVVAGVAVSVVVPILLERIGRQNAVVADIPDAVSVGVLLSMIRDASAVVADVSHPVSVDVRLARVGYRRTVVLPGAQTVVVLIVERIQGAGVANVADAVVIQVFLSRIVEGR